MTPLLAQHTTATDPLAYVLIDRERLQDVAVQYRDLTDAVHALDHDPLIDSICEEDCIDRYVSEDPADLEGREVIDPARAVDQ